MDRHGDLDAPLQLGLSANDCLVVLYTPSGERIALSAGAALRSARALEQAGRQAQLHASLAGNVVPARFDRARRLTQRRWQTLREEGRNQPLCWLVAMMLLPVGLALCTALAFVLLLLAFSEASVMAAGLFLPIVGLALAVPLSWLAAPLAMSHEERACRPPPGTRPQLVASNDAAAT